MPRTGRPALSRFRGGALCIASQAVSAETLTSSLPLLRRFLKRKKVPHRKRRHEPTSAADCLPQNTNAVLTTAPWSSTARSATASAESSSAAARCVRMKVGVCDPVVVVWYPGPAITITPPTADEARRVTLRAPRWPGCSSLPQLAGGDGFSAAWKITHASTSCPRCGWTPGARRASLDYDAPITAGVPAAASGLNRTQSTTSLHAAPGIHAAARACLAEPTHLPRFALRRVRTAPVHAGHSAGGCSAS